MKAKWSNPLKLAQIIGSSKHIGKHFILMVKNIALSSLIATMLLAAVLAVGAQENAFTRTFVDTIFSEDGKRFLTQDENSRYEVWNADGTLIKRFTDFETDVATISRYVRPLGIEYPEPTVNHKYTRINNDRDTIYTLTVNGVKVFEHTFTNRNCGIFAYYLPAKKIGTLLCLGGEAWSTNQFQYLIKPDLPPRELDYKGANLTYGMIAPDGKTIVDVYLMAAYNIETDKPLWSRTGGARVIPNIGVFQILDSDWSLTFSPDNKFVGVGTQGFGLVVDLASGETIVHEKKRSLNKSYRWLPNMKSFLDSGGNFHRRPESQRRDYSTWKNEYGLPYDQFRNFVRNAVIGVGEKYDKCVLEQSQILSGEKFATGANPNVWTAPRYENWTTYIIVTAGNKNFLGMKVDIGDVNKIIPPQPISAARWKAIIGLDFKPFTPHPEVQFAAWNISTNRPIFTVTPVTSDGSPTALFQYKCPY